MSEETERVEQIPPEEAEKFKDKSVEPNVFKRVGRAVKNVAKKAGTFAIQHPFITMGIISVTTSAIELGKDVVKMNNTKNVVYDDFTHQNVTLKRSMKPREMREFCERKEAGERTTNILGDMGLLKRSR